MAIAISTDTERLELAERIKWARRSSGLTAREVAEKMTEAGHPRWNPNIIGKIEKAERNVFYVELITLAGIFGQPLPWLLGDKDVAPVAVLDPATVVTGRSLKSWPVTPVRDFAVAA